MSLSKNTRFLSSMLLFVVLNTFQHLSFAQTPEVDSLLTVIRTAKEDTHKVKALNELSYATGWRVGNLDTAFYYAKNAKLLSEKLNFKKGVANSHNNIGVVYYFQSNYPDALKNYFAALKINEELGDRSRIASSYYNLGNVYDEQGNYTEALKNYFASLKIKEEIGNKRGVANCYNNLGNIYTEQGNYPEALKIYLASLRTYEEIGDKKGIAISYNNIGVICKLQSNYPEALKNYFASFKIYEEIGDKGGMASSYNNIGTIFRRQGNYSEALKNYFASLKIREEIGDKRGMASSYGNIGNMYKIQRNYFETRKNYFASLKIYEKIGDKKGIAHSYGNIGDLYISLGDDNSARKYVSKGLKLSKELGAKNLITDNYQRLSALDSAEGRYKNAYNNYKLYILYRDSLLNEENTKKTTQLAMQYEFDKKEAVAQAEQEKKDAITTEQLHRKNQQRNAFLGGFVLMLGLAGVSFRSYRIKKRDNGIISAQKEAVEKKNHEILESINYAKKLQTAVLPPAKVVKEFFANSFLLYLPRDIVSGDFYWMENKGDTSYFAVADCTGHGVPGAMLSIIGLNGLNRALNEKKLTEPKYILTSLSETVNRHFEKSDATVRDGMDICLCALNNKTKKLTFSGANNPLWIARQNEMLILKGDRRAIGHDDLEQKFTQQEIQLQDGDTVYLTSDGYQDQLGGKKYLKMMTKVFRTRLLVLSAKSMEEQRSTLISDLDTWKGKHGQTDDVCVMGIRI